MKAHGDFEIYLSEPVIFGMPKSLFNPTGVDNYFNAIACAAESMPNWVYFEVPQNHAVYTDAALKNVLKHYQKLADHGCTGIVLQLSNVVARVLQHQQQLDELPIPFLASKNQIEIGKFVEELMPKDKTDTLQQTG